MATDRSSANAAGGDDSRKQGTKGTDWSEVVPKSVDSEDVMNSEDAKTVWEAMYKDVFGPMANEKQRASLRCAVYVYCAKNGTSREGDYSGRMTLADGTKVDASVIPRSASKMKIRKFLRACMTESYDCFKTTRCMEGDARFIAKAATLSIAPEAAFATADWLTDCPKFTPGENRAHEISFTRGLERARRSRGDKTLEKVEDERIDASMKVQGPNGGDRGSPAGAW